MENLIFSATCRHMINFSVSLMQRGLLSALYSATKCPSQLQVHHPPPVILCSAALTSLSEQLCAISSCSFWGLRCCCWFIHQNPHADTLTGLCSNTGFSCSFTTTPPFSLPFPSFSLSTLQTHHARSASQIFPEMVILLKNRWFDLNTVSKPSTFPLLTQLLFLLIVTKRYFSA